MNSSARTASIVGSACAGPRSWAGSVNTVNPRPGCEEQVEGGDQGEGLHDLDGQAGGEGAPPPAGDALGLGQGVEHQRDRRSGDQHHGQEHPHHVGEQHRDQPERRPPSPRISRNAAPVSVVTAEVSSCVARPPRWWGRHRRRGGRWTGRWRCPRRTRPGSATAPRPGTRAGSGGDLAQAVAGLHGFVAHDQDPGEQDEQAVGGEHDLPRLLPQLPQPG